MSQKYACKGLRMDREQRVRERSTVKSCTHNLLCTLAKTLVIATFAIAFIGQAADIGPWPTNQPYLWSTNPFSPVCGLVYQQADLPNNLVMASYHSGQKNGAWLPYGSINGSAWEERLCVAKLIRTATAPVTNIHVKVLDQRGASGANGWAVIFKDSAGRILDFGVRPFFRPPYIMAHEWNGTNWVNWAGNNFFTPYYERSGVNPAYYTMDFAQNGDGTLTWTIHCSDSSALSFPATNTSSIAYGAITEVYLGASTTSASTSVNYKWTEFSVLPQLLNLPTLNVERIASSVRLSWLSSWSNFVLLANPDLNTTTWTNVTEVPADDGTNITVTIPIEAGNRFFRLTQ